MLGWVDSDQDFFSTIGVTKGTLAVKTGRGAVAQALWTDAAVAS